VELTIGIVIGIIIGTVMFRRPVGNLRVDRSDPTCGPRLFLELGTDVRTVMRKKYVTFKVRVENFLPHEYQGLLREPTPEYF